MPGQIVGDQCSWNEEQSLQTSFGEGTDHSDMRVVMQHKRMLESRKCRHIKHGRFRIWQVLLKLNCCI